MLEPLKIEVKGTDYQSLYKKTFVDVDERLGKEPVCISFGTKYNEYTPIVTYGNFMAIVGPSKSMKTFLKTAMEACYIGGSAQNYFPEMIGHETHGKYILSFDTEQGKRHVQKAARRVVTMCGAKNEFYIPFSLRELSATDRIAYIEYLLDNNFKGKDIGLITIDGVADLVENVNDLEKSNEIVQKLMKITSDRNCGMVTVIHKNFDSAKPTGHLGSAVLKKSETVLFVDRNNETVSVEPKYTRNIPIDEFTFNLDQDGLPAQSDNIFR